jgi:hypothetical protein
MTQTSTLFTVGTLLSRARDGGAVVRVLVEGHWIEGVPVQSDGHGVVIDGPEGSFLVRMEAVSAVSFPQAPEPAAPPAEPRARAHPAGSARDEDLLYA